MEHDDATETFARTSPLGARGGQRRYDDAEIASWVHGLAGDQRWRRPGVMIALDAGGTNAYERDEQGRRRRPASLTRMRPPHRNSCPVRT